MTTGDRQEVRLDDPIPVYLMYLTAFAHADGTVSFYQDIYGHDEALDEALAAQARSVEDGETEAVCQALQRLKKKL